MFWKVLKKKAHRRLRKLTCKIKSKIFTIKYYTSEALEDAMQYGLIFVAGILIVCLGAGLWYHAYLEEIAAQIVSIAGLLIAVIGIVGCEM